MSKMVNVTVSASISTDFFIEVPDDATEEQIKEQARKEIVLPSDYPKFLDGYLKSRMGIDVRGIDKLVKAWNTDELKFIVEDNE